MITLLKSYTANPTGKDNTIKSRAVMKLAGLSTDEKPLIKFKDIEIENGSSFIEIDTSKVYKYDEENNEWIEQVKGSNKDIIIENNALLTYINEVTGGDDDNLSEAITTLVDGYGSGGYSIDDIASGDEPSGDIVITTTTIKQYAFISCKNIKKITTTNTTTISTSAFNGCGVTEIYMPLVVTIQATAFAYCWYLEKISLPAISNLTTSVFGNCNRLKYIYLPNVKSLGHNTFIGCKELQTISLPSCTSISTTTFTQCSALTDIYLPNNASTYSGAPWGATNATIHYNTQFDENGEPILE